MKNIVIFGAGDHAELSYYYFKHDSDFKPAAFTVHQSYIKQDSFCGLPLVPFEEITSLYSPEDYGMFVAVGYAKLNKARANVCKEAREKGYRLMSYVSSRAITWPDFNCGENCFILEQNNIQPFAKIGNNVTLWSGNHIGHHAVIDDNCFITSHVVISGRVMVGQNCFIGVNSTIRDNVVIAKDCIIGAGSLIVQNTEEGRVYTSQPSELSKVPSRRLGKI